MEGAAGGGAASRTAGPGRCGVRVCTTASARGASEGTLHTARPRGEKAGARREYWKGFQRKKTTASALYLDRRRGPASAILTRNRGGLPGPAVELPGLERLTVLPRIIERGTSRRRGFIYVATPELRVLRIRALGQGDGPTKTRVESEKSDTDSPDSALPSDSGSAGHCACAACCGSRPATGLGRWRELYRGGVADVGAGSGPPSGPRTFPALFQPVSTLLSAFQFLSISLVSRGPNSLLGILN